MRAREDVAALVGRIAISVIFILGGWGKLFAPAATQATFAGNHLPLVQVAWVIAVVVELGGGSALLFGLVTRPIGLVLAAWCIATALIAHADFGQRSQEINFLKNLAMAGGLLYVAAIGAGAFSLDRWLTRHRGVVADRG